jgi:hypothetical protein
MRHEVDRPSVCWLKFGQFSCRLTLTLVAVSGLTQASCGSAKRFNPAFGSALILHQAGAYGLPQSVPSSASGLRLSISVAVPPISGKPPPAAVHYLDSSLWGLVSAAVPHACVSTPTPCRITRVAHQRLVKDIQVRLKATSDDKRIVGFYLLDDYPGNIKGVLEEVHAMVVRANRSSVIRRATVCAFYATLDSKIAQGFPYRPYHVWFNQAIINFSPKACDFISVYAYAPFGVGPDKVDWSMKALLPFITNAFRKAGWNQRTEPLIGTPQTFGFPRYSPKPPGSNKSLPGYAPTRWYAPTSGDLQRQVQAFCAAGAVGIIAYAWNDGYPGVKQELYNDRSLVSGLSRGLSRCRTLWLGKAP